MTAIRDDWSRFEASLAALGFTDDPPHPTDVSSLSATQANGDIVTIYVHRGFRGELWNVALHRQPNPSERLTCAFEIAPVTSSTFALALVRAACDHTSQPAITKTPRSAR